MHDNDVSFTGPIIVSILLTTSTHVDVLSSSLKSQYTYNINIDVLEIQYTILRATTWPLVSEISSRIVNGIVYYCLYYCSYYCFYFVDYLFL